MIYIAGSLFTEAEISQRLKEAELLRTELKEKLIKQGVNEEEAKEKALSLIFNPIENPFNDKSTKPSAESIFNGDYTVIKASTHLLFNLDNPVDTGVFVELGQALEMKDKKIYPVISDIRMATAGDYQEHHVPFGLNQYVIGGLDHYGLKIYTSSQEAIRDIVLDIKV